MTGDKFTYGNRRAAAVILCGCKEIGEDEAVKVDGKSKRKIIDLDPDRRDWAADASNGRHRQYLASKHEVAEFIIREAAQATQHIQGFEED